MWSSRPYIPPAPFISGERAGLEFWFTLATIAGRSDTSTRQPVLFAHSGARRAARRCACGSLGPMLRVTLRGADLPTVTLGTGERLLFGRAPDQVLRIEDPDR